ncbi:MAG: hypothetical protein JNM93_02175 [Bacteriovoracaceae bacterium]|nr:hypothetical protein [Bacteriovoracaceae bacterium]
MKKPSLYLFLDTTCHLTIGLLDNKFSWVSYQHLQHEKSSQVIHELIYELVKKANGSINDLAGVFQVSGPGSYTGMRVGEGIAQILSWQGIESFSFYHFEVPGLLEIPTGIWISRAFKGEYFGHQWMKNKNSSSLYSVDALMAKLRDKDMYTHYLDDLKLELKTPVTLTSKMIYEQPQKLFSSIEKNKLKRELYYYRALEQEFTKKI